MRVVSERFGALDIDEARIIVFDDGLLGFPGVKRFAMIDADDDGGYFWLQDVDDPTLAFLTVVPWPFFPDYEPAVPEPEQSALGLQHEADAIVLCLLTVQGDPQAITANLLGPLVVNRRTRQARQIVLAESGYPVRAPLAA